MPRAVVTVAFGSEAEAQTAEAALLPELGDDVPGSRSALARQGAILELTLEADDAGALRAGLNSYLRLLEVARAMHGLARGA